MNIELSVIIVNYNGLQFLQSCFDSLVQNLNEINYEIIVFDNNSVDESAVFIKERYPNVVFIESKQNLGFGVGNNRAVAAAKGDYLLLINNDTIVLDELKPILEHLKSDDSIGVIGIKMLNKQKDYLQSVGNFPNPTNMLQLKKLLLLGKEFEFGNFNKDSYEVDWMAGSFLMLSKQTYQEIGGFDKDYFMYVEDVDFCKKIANLGYKRIFLPDFSYIHFVGFSNSKNPQLIKGYEIYITKHCKGLNKFICQFAIKINNGVKNLKKNLKIE
jgi:GT2 family glycosyltransferase